MASQSCDAYVPSTVLPGPGPVSALASWLSPHLPGLFTSPCFLPRYFFSTSHTSSHCTDHEDQDPCPGVLSAQRPATALAWGTLPHPESTCSSLNCQCLCDALPALYPQKASCLPMVSHGPRITLTILEPAHASNPCLAHCCPMPWHPDQC